jgi:branched-chain amino acid transport system substrate-binding protein
MTGREQRDERRGLSRRTFLKWTGGSLVGLGLGSLLGRIGAAQLPDTLRIGAMFPLNLAEGGQAKEGAELAVRLINEAGGIAGRTNIELITVDDKCSGSEGTVVANDLIAQEVQFVIGNFCSGAALATQPIFAAAGIPQIIWAFATDLTGASREENNATMSVRLGPQAVIEMAPLAKYAAVVNGHKRFFAFAQDTGFGRSMVDAFRATLEGLGGEFVQDPQFFRIFQLEAIGPIITAAKNSGAEAVLGIGLAPEEIEMVSQFNAQGLRDAGMIFYGSDLLNDSAFQGAISQGDRNGIYFPWVYDNGDDLRTFPRTAPEPGARKMDEAFREALGKPAVRNNGWGWGSIELIRQAIEQLGSADPAAVAQLWLEGATAAESGPAFELPYGNYGFLACGQADMRTGVATYAAGKRTLIADRTFGEDVVTDLC